MMNHYHKREKEREKKKRVREKKRMNEKRRERMKLMKGNVGIKREKERVFDSFLSSSRRGEQESSKKFLILPHPEVRTINR